MDHNGDRSDPVRRIQRYDGFRAVVKAYDDRIAALDSAVRKQPGDGVHHVEKLSVAHPLPKVGKRGAFWLLGGCLPENLVNREFRDLEGLFWHLCPHLRIL